MDFTNTKEIQLHRTPEGLLYAKVAYGGKVVDELVSSIKTSGGVCQIRNGSTGGGHSGYTNIDATGSVRGMKNQGYWKKDDRTVRAHGQIYNLSQTYISHPLDVLALMIERKPHLAREIDSITPGSQISIGLDGDLQ